MSEGKKKILLFDWDGTIVDSNRFKWEGAWQLVFEGEPEKQGAIKKVFLRPEGRVYTRWELVRETLSELGDSAVKDLDGEALRSDPRITKYTDKFKDILETGYDHMPLFDASSVVLEKLHKKGFKMYVISNSVTAGLKHMANHYGVLDFFVDMYGLPLKKFENFELISQKEGTDVPLNYVYIGDGENDKALAEQIGCEFIGIGNEWNKWEDGKESFKVIKSLDGLENIL